MAKYKCTKCKKKFDSLSKLERHYQRKTPCDVKLEFKCARCLKIFGTKFNYERHMKRKNPCINVVISSNDDKIALEREKLKLKQKELDIKEKEIEYNMEKLKLKNEEKEKDRLLKEKLSENDMKKIKLKEDAGIEIQKLKNEKVHLQKEKNMEVEILKTKRKEKTTNIINNIETINIQNNFIQQINEKYVNTDVLCLDTDRFRKNEKDIYKRKIHRENDFNIYLFNNSKTIRDFICFFLKRIFNNEKFPTMKCLFYNKELDKFYGIFQNPETKEIRQIDYEKYIDSVFRPMLIELFKNMKQYCEEHKKNINPNDKGYDKYIDITSGRLSTLDTLENVSKDALYDGYMISKEEYDHIIMGAARETLVC